MTIDVTVLSNTDRRKDGRSRQIDRQTDMQTDRKTSFYLQSVNLKADLATDRVDRNNLS
jgi:hypothetical protein